ncbi:MAG: tetratricopeptide repeat protein [Spirochaetia bacterium]|nr:tetratricopeptide repeat protein [Spirochaetia bacterium]
MFQLNTENIKIIIHTAVVIVSVFFITDNVFSETSLELKNKADAYYSKSDYRSAVHMYRQSIAKNPNNKNAHVGAGKSYLHLYDYNRSEYHFKYALKLDKNNENAMIGLGFLYLELNKFKEAKELLDQVSKINPGNNENNYAKGLMYLKQNKYSISELYFKKVLKLNAGHILSLLALGEIEIKRGRNDIAEDYWNKARKINPLNPEIHKMRAKLDLHYANEKEDSDDRDIYLQRARESLINADTSGNSEINQEKKIIWIDIMKGDDVSALDRVTEILKKNKKHPEMNYLAAILSAQSDRPPDIVASYYLNLLNFNSDDSITRFSFEEYVLSKEQFFSPSGEIRKNLSYYHLSLANKYESEGQMRRSLAHLQRGIMLYPDSKVLLEKRKEKMLYSGNFEGYLRDLVLLKRKSPENFKLLHRLETALKDKKRYISYRERLLSSDDIGGHPTFNRTPPYIFVYHIRPEESFPDYPDASKILSDAIILYLNEAGKSDPVPAHFRKKIISSISNSSRTKMHTGKGVYFSSSNLPFIEEFENKNMQVSYILDGSYSVNNGMIRMKIQLMEKNTARPIMNFNVQAKGKNAIHDLAYKINKKIENLPHTGKIIKVSHQKVFINKGKSDGLRKGDLYSVPGKSNLEIDEVDYYVSSARPVKGKSAVYTIGEKAMQKPGSRQGKSD